jgi:hypothetical protein
MTSRRRRTSSGRFRREVAGDGPFTAIGGRKVAIAMPRGGYYVAHAALDCFICLRKQCG